MNYKQISNIDQSISTSLEGLSDAINTIQFKDSVGFTIEKADDLINFNELHHPGVYLIEVSNSDRVTDFNEWSENFLGKWHDEAYRKKFTPNSRKMRLKAHLESSNMDWIPLYLGKSRNIGKRVHQHIHLGLDKPTFALKLRARKNIQDLAFRLSCIKIDVKNYNVIMPLVESQLRNRINPILGRQ
ncbi:hypothetical protein JKA74_09825 [Marivirga sp. S37H4]|uniref:Uncharacterized protein n=1 Tax=Marivirga aurantiaca TaxID=2802615 RepID=A0A934WYP7_9BACT|nr:hypothetical protein [Marivirga aurantiaca]MBK6265337.1 hypothetical protein [Marivirga aurantiaca]